MKPTDHSPARPRKFATGRLTAAARGGSGCPIVGIGASAGGLEAFTRLLKQLPLDTGFGFVLVQHLDPQHESALAQLLTRATAMPVVEVTNQLRVRPNHVYIIPPNTVMGIARGVLQLRPRSPSRLALRSIDCFFEALAADQHERAIGVILSGTANDGTLGLEAIKAEGGLTFAQDDSARYDSMPRSAAAAGCVDLVLSPENIARELARIARHPYVAGQSPETVPPSNGRNGAPAPGGAISPPARGRRPARTVGPDRPLPAPAIETAGGTAAAGYRQILLLLRDHSHVDFALYKTSTIHRRIRRRAVLSRRNNLEDYATFLRGNPKELDALYGDALIGVTSFFRNADAFDVLQHVVFPRLLQEPGDEPLRAWVLGCSTGQEAYSLAMAFTEAAEKVVRTRKLQVFATDLNEASLKKARQGHYAKTLVQDVAPARLQRFFVEEDGGYRVIKALRESVVFARQNVTSDPPFSRMDLISCRNVLIYLEASLQKKIIPAFHYALKPGGVLFLGASESIGPFTDLFQPVDRKQKIFLKKEAPTKGFHLPVPRDRGDRPPAGPLHPTGRPAGRNPGGRPDLFPGELNAEREADRVTVNQFAPPGVLINADLQILQFRGPTGAYLEPPAGKASFNLLKMAREGLMLPLRAAILRARKENRTVRQEGVTVLQNGANRLVHLEVVPLKNLKERCFLVLFSDAEKSGPAGASAVTVRTSRAAGRKEESHRVVGLERDLAETRDYLQSVQENQESANDELQASNEEGQSANEELQSLNEELETSKEELESTNEELTTVNDEMINRNSELNRLNADLTNLQVSTRFVIVVLGRDLTIRRFSAEAEKQFRLHAGDVGRPVGAVRHNLRLPDLSAIIAEVVAGGPDYEREVQDRERHWYALRVRPYLTADHKVDGAVLVLIDIDDLKKAERLVTEAHEHAEAIIRTVPNPLVTLSTDLRVLSTNEAFNRAFKLAPGDTTNRSFFEIDRGAWNTPKLRRLLKDVIGRNTVVNEFEVTHNFARIGRRSLLLNARVLNELGGKTKEILLGVQDVTDVLAFQADVRRSEMRYRRLFEAAQDGILILDPVTHRITDANPYLVRLLGYSRKQLLKKELWQIGLLKDEAANREAFRALKAKGFIRYEGLPLKSKGGRHHEVEFVSNLYDEGGETVIQCNVRDITERKRGEKALRQAQGQLAQHAAELEQQVARRTAQLTQTNQQLVASVDSLRQAQEQYRKLLEESQEMQKKLRQLTRQLISAQEEERKEISRELHDEIVQMLVGINVQLAAIAKESAVGGHRQKAKIAHTQRLVEKSIDAVHQFARELRPAVLDDLGLIPALHTYVRNLVRRKKLKIEMTVFREIENVNEAKRTVLFRVAQEALTNVMRHAHATKVKLNILRRPGAVRMEVCDNGRSFNVRHVLESKTSKRLGLLGMRERVEMVGGSLTIQSAPRRGTVVRVEIPL